MYTYPYLQFEILEKTSNDWKDVFIILNIFSI